MNQHHRFHELPSPTSSYRHDREFNYKEEEAHEGVIKLTLTPYFPTTLRIFLINALPAFFERQYCQPCIWSK